MKSADANGDRRTLIIGGGGVIGRILARELTGKKVILDVGDVDRDLADREDIEWHVGDAAHQDVLSAAMADVSAVIYLPTGAPEWAGLLDVDMMAFKSTCEMSIKFGVRRVIYASSNHVVGGVERDHLEGSPKLPPYRPDEVPRPDSPYGVAKLFGEALCRYYSEIGQISTSCVRIGTVRSKDDLAACAEEPYFDYIEGGKEAVMDRLRRTWLHHEDLINLFEEELRSSDRFRLRFGISPDNPDPYWSPDVLRWNESPPSD